MAVTWEQARVLERYHSLPSSQVMKLANVMRSVGVRRENAFKNINKDKVVSIFKFAPPNAGDSVRFQCFTVEPAT